MDHGKLLLLQAQTTILKAKLRGRRKGSKRPTLGGKGKYEESKHPRDARGHFKDKPDAPKVGGGGKFKSYDKTPLWDLDKAKLRSRSLRDLRHATANGVRISEKDALSYYTHNGNLSINKTLRRGKQIEGVTANRSDSILDMVTLSQSQNDARAIAGMDSLLGRTRLAENLVVYRAAKGPGWDKLFKSAKVGKSFTDPGFVSASLKRGEAEAFGTKMLVMRLPKGSNALPLQDWSNSYTAFEQEVIVARGSKFKVLKKSKNELVVQLKVR